MLFLARGKIDAVIEFAQPRLDDGFQTELFRRISAGGFRAAQRRAIQIIDLVLCKHFGKQLCFPFSLFGEVVAGVIGIAVTNDQQPHFVLFSSHNVSNFFSDKISCVTNLPSKNRLYDVNGAGEFCASSAPLKRTTFSGIPFCRAKSSMSGTYFAV